MNDFTEIDPAAAQELMQKGSPLQLVDVREPHEHRAAHIEGVTLIPLADLPNRYSELDSNLPVLCICAGGVRSERAAQFLCSQGFEDVTNMLEGVKGWESRGLPLTRGA